MAKRISSTAVNWNLLAEYTAKRDKEGFTAFKAYCDKYMRSTLALPAELPKIDWARYQGRIAPAVVDSFQKQYQSMKIPYPSDLGFLESFKKDEELSRKKVEDANAEINKNIQELKKELEVLLAQMPISQMNLEEFMEAYPQFRIDPENPKLWPQNMPDKIVEKEDH